MRLNYECIKSIKNTKFICLDYKIYFVKINLYTDCIFNLSFTDLNVNNSLSYFLLTENS